MFDTEALEQVLALLPEPQSDALVAALLDGQAAAPQRRAVVQEALGSLDWARQRQHIASLIGRLLPLEHLVPEVYCAWRPIMRDAVVYLCTHLALERLLPKLTEQLLLPADLPLEQRLGVLLARMPSLQKLGQVMARNRHLDMALRTELTRLENAIQDIDAAEMHADLHRQLGQQLAAYQIDVQDEPLAEASVSVALRFTWRNPHTGERERGVFKVLKPYVRQHFAEELALLQGLAGFFEANQQRYGFAQAPLRDMFDDVCRLLARETDFLQEQASLEAARQRYAQVPGIRIPRLMPDLCTPSITATSEEDGVKITAAYTRTPRRRRQAAVQLIETLLAMPLFAPEETAMLHADPHAGNLLVDERTGELIVLDWALTEPLQRRDRRHIVLLLLAVTLRDPRLAFNAVAELSADDLQRDREQAAVVRRHIGRFIRRLSPCTIAGPRQVLRLLDTLVYAGVRFSAALLVARKILFTLHGVLHDLAPEVRLTPVLLRYVLRQGRGSAFWLPWAGTPASNFRWPLASIDWLTLSCSAALYSTRVWQQVLRLPMRHA